MDPEINHELRRQELDETGGACAFRGAEIVEYRHTGARRARKDKMPGTDEICGVRPAKSLLPLLVSNSSPPGPHPHPHPFTHPSHLGHLGQTNYTTESIVHNTRCNKGLSFNYAVPQ